jgi:hypothetical protein
MSASNGTSGAWRILTGGVTLFVLLLAAIPVSAQGLGAILGVAKDASGGVVPDVNVTLTNTDTSEVRTVSTGNDGGYRFPGIRPGHYSVKMEKQGFKTATRAGLNLDVSQELVVDIGLEVGTSMQVVTVTGELPLVNTTNSSLGGLVNDQQIVDLPLNGRNYTDLVFLQTGIAPNAHPLGGGAGAVGNWFSSNGSPPRSNFFTLDGSPVGNAYNTGPNSEGNNAMGVDGIKEFRIVTSMFGAEYGMNMGAQVIMVSKGGTNNFHGDAFGFIRNNHLDARGFFDP